MTLALDRTSRAALACAALLAFAGAFSSAPATVNDAGGTSTLTVRARAPAKPVRIVTILPRRDPFAGGLPAAVRTAARPAVAPPFLSIPPALGPLPPNAGAGGGLLPTAPAKHVSAIVTGTPPYALVDDGSTTRLVTVGDRLDGASIVAIDTAGVHLTGGTTLPVTQRPSFQLQRPNAGGRQP